MQVNLSLKELVRIELAIEKELAAATEDYKQYLDEQDSSKMKILEDEIEIYKSILEKLK